MFGCKQNGFQVLSWPQIWLVSLRAVNANSVLLLVLLGYGMAQSKLASLCATPLITATKDLPPHASHLQHGDAVIVHWSVCTRWTHQY